MQTALTNRTTPRSRSSASTSASRRSGRPRPASASAPGEPLQTPLRVSPSSLGDIPDAAALAQSSIGQRDVGLTPLQAAMIAAAVSNNGVLMTPYLVDRWRRRT